MLPRLEEQIASLNKEVERYNRLLNEEKDKFEQERDKLVKQSGIIESDLKSVKRKHQYYEQEHINEVISRVSKEPALEYELKSLTRMYNELTNTYSDIIRKYNLLEQGIDAEFVKFENESNKRILLLKEKLNNKISALKKTCDEQVERNKDYL